MSLPKPSLAQLERTLGYQFKNPELAQQALTHRSADHQHNERLEFLGDAILGFVIAQRLYELFPDAPEGDLSRMRATIVCGKSLAKLAKKFDLGPSIHLGPGEMKSGGHRRESILADVVEALLGAILLESGQAQCRQVILNWFGDILATTKPGQANKDAKTRLQEYLQGRQLELPEYEVVATAGQAHNQQFTVTCRTPIIAEAVAAVATNRRKAEQAAATLMLDKIKEVTGHDA